MPLDGTPLKGGRRAPQRWTARPSKLDGTSPQMRMHPHPHAPGQAHPPPPPGTLNAVVTECHQILVTECHQMSCITSGCARACACVRACVRVRVRDVALSTGEGTIDVNRKKN